MSLCDNLPCSNEASYYVSLYAEKVEDNAEEVYEERDRCLCSSCAKPVIELIKAGR
jgi:hypothetical protein